MRAVFVDADDALAAITEKLRREGDLPVAINRDRDVTPDELPAILGDAEIAIIDHTPLPTLIAAQCRGLKHVVFLGTGARSYMNPEELAGRGITVHIIKGYGDTAVAECAIALMWASARGVVPMDRGMRADRWLGIEGVQLTGKTLGLVGFGGVAAEVARIVLGSGIKVAAGNLQPASLSLCRIGTARRGARPKRRRLAAPAADRRDHGPPVARAHCRDEAGCHFGEYGARRAGRRGGNDRGAAVGPQPPCGPRRLRHRTDAGRPHPDHAGKRHPLRPFRVPDTRGERQSYRRGTGPLPSHCRHRSLSPLANDVQRRDDGQQDVRRAGCLDKDAVSGDAGLTPFGFRLAGVRVDVEMRKVGARYVEPHVVSAAE